MKKISKLIISLVLVLAGFSLGMNLLGAKSVFAETPAPTNYFSVVKEFYNEANTTDDKYAPKENAPIVTDGSAIFLSSGQRVKVSLGADTEDVKYSQKVVSLTYKISVNDLTFDNQASAAMEVYGMSLKLSQNYKAFELIINPELVVGNNGTFNYGKYTFEFSYYYITDDLVQEAQTFTSSVYILNYDNYFNNVQFFNSMNNGTVDKYFSNYSTQNLMYLNYDYRFFNLNIVRVYQGLSTSTTLSYSNGQLTIASTDELGATTSNNNVMVSTSSYNNRAFITFRDLGVYYLTYTAINPYGQNEVISSFYEDSPTLTQTAYVFGYQLYYTSQSGLNEFKKVNETNSWQIDGTSFSADVTSLVSSRIDDLYSINVSDIAKTNQAPVYPQTNAIIDSENSKYYYYATNSEFEAKTPTETFENYTGSPVSRLGIYLVELSYTYSDFSGDSQKQYFLFKITSDAPEVKIYRMNSDSGVKIDINNDEFTCEDVYITKSALGIFDSESTLMVYSDTSFTGSYNAGTEVAEGGIATFSQTARYRVELTYGNTNQKGFTSYFTIDKEEISEIEFKNLYKDIGLNYRAGAVLNAPYMTNNAVALSWKEKISGATVTAEYKYFGTKYSATNTSGLTSDFLKTLYNSQTLRYSIPSTYVISYAGGDVPVSDYSNTYGKTIFVEDDAIVTGGLYIFHIYDNTGAEGKYYAIFIDDAPNSIISSSNDIYKIAADSEVTTVDTTVYFGRTKLIKIDFDINGQWDEWLSNYLTDDNSAIYRNERYLKVGVNSRVYYTKDGAVNNISLDGTNSYSFAMYAETNGVANDSQYIFYTIADSTMSNSIYNKDSYEYYKQNYSNSHFVTFSTDNSRMIVFYTEEGKTSMLEQCPIVTTNNTKTAYYQPTAVDTLKKAGEVLRLSYNIKPSDDLEVESIELKYYAFEADEANPTYKFNLFTPSSTITIYQKGSINWGTSIEGQLNTYLYEINKETYNGSNTRTKAGRYEIIRTYTDESSLNDNDPIVRKLVFIVDRNGIISDPVIGNKGESVYYTGSGIQLQIINKYGLNYYSEETLHFYDIYYATKLNQDKLVSVLTTNFLPVTVYIPTYKYGYIANKDGYPVFTPEESIVSYTNGTGGKEYLNNYKLSAYVEYRATESSAVSSVYNYNTILSSNFLTTTGSGNSIVSFNQQGFYKVNISSGAGDTFSFVFEIKYSSPEFDVLDTENTPVNSDQNGVYYTNKKSVRISWEDSPSVYLARINQNAIQYTINGVTGVIDPNKTPIQSAGENKYYVDLDLEALGAYVDNTDVYITLQFNGKKEDYNNSEYFSKTVQLRIDLQAPVYNVGKLTTSTGLSFYDLRRYGDDYRYNSSVNTGLFRYFAYTVDKSTFAESILTPQGTNYDYYKMYYKVFVKDGVNTKYLAGSNNETDITLTDLTGQTNGTIWGDSYTNFDDILRTYSDVYLELIEEDYAGNRTVYTIYLSNVANYLTEEALTYSYLTDTSANLGETTRSVTYEDLTSTMSLYSKYSFNLESLNLFKNPELGDLTWQLISVNNNLYVKSPYSNGKFYSYNTYNPNKENVTYTLKELTMLYSSANSQTINIYSVPVLKTLNLNVYVLNKTLEIYTLSQVMDSNLYEGILVKLPNERTNENNVLYATSLSIKANFGGTFVTTYEIDSKFLLEEQTTIPTLNNIQMSYVTYRGTRFLQVEILGNIAINDYFVYTLTDNFGEEYSVVHIYGQTEISEPITSEGYIAESYDATGAIVYYSSENITYRYDTTIYEKLNLFVGKDGTETGYTIVKTDIGYNVLNYGTTEPADKMVYENYFVVVAFNNVFAITMKQISYNFGLGQYGGSRTFALELIPKSDFNISNEKLRFEIFNALPNTLNIISKSSAVNVTSILGGSLAYAGEVIINYVYSTLKFDYEILIMNPNGDIMALTDQMLISEDGTYTIIINYLGDINGCSKAFEFTVAKSEEFIYSVVLKTADGTYKTVKATGAGYTYTENKVRTTISTHYIVNGEYEIVLNSNLYLTAEIEKGPIDNYTYIYKISNLNSKEAEDGLVTEYYTSRIAISVIPQSGDILKRLVHYGSNVKEQTDDLLAISNPSITPYVTTKDEYDAGIRIAWSKYNLIPENTISVEVFYGDIDGMKYNATIEEINSLNSITLKTSGTYYIKFIDKAGNVQLFGAYSDNQYFTIKYLSSVIFEVQSQTPINYAIYDTDVIVSIPDITLGYYDVNAKPVLSVELNGVEYKEYEKVSQYNWKFSERGLYKVWFTAKIDEKNIYEAPIYFTILSSKESRISYTYNSYTKYYLQDIKLNGESVNSRLANINNGELVTIDGISYLKSLSLHSSDIKTGNGYWTFVVNTNNEFDQVFEFTIWINKAIVPIQLSVENGSSTTDTIVVSFNTKNILTATGDCILKITGHAPLVLTEELLESGKLNQIYEISISSSGKYYIEVTSLSGQLLYSSYVVKTEPLNAVSIIIIVVSVIVLGTGIVLFVLLRRKMKVR